MSVSAFLALLGVWTLGCISPGPDVLMVLTQALRGRALPAALGVVTGLSVWVIVSLAGTSWVATRYLPAFHVLSLAGGVFLLIYGGYEAIHAWRAWSRASIPEAAACPVAALKTPTGDAVEVAANPAAASPIKRPSRRSAYFAGLATNLANPKALAFFTALFASLLPAEPGLLLSAAIAGNMITIALLWFCTLALVTRIQRVQATITRYEHPLGVFLGSVLAVLGGAVLATNLF